MRLRNENQLWSSFSDRNFATFSKKEITLIYSYQKNLGKTFNAGLLNELFFLNDFEEFILLIPEFLEPCSTGRGSKMPLQPIVSKNNGIKETEHFPLLLPFF